MKKETEKLVRETASMSSNMSTLTVDKINEMAPEADTVEVKNAEYVNGMLKIFLENVVPEEKKAKKVDIK